MKALVGAFNQEKALVGAFSVIVQPVMEPMDCFRALFIFPEFNITSIKYYLFLLCVYSVHSSGIIYWDWVIVQLSTNKVDSVLKRRGAGRGAYLRPGSAGHSVQCRWGFGKWFEKSFPLISRNNLSPAQLTQQLPPASAAHFRFCLQSFLTHGNSSSMFSSHIF